jgi:Glycosyltransferase family 87
MRRASPRCCTASANSTYFCANPVADMTEHRNHHGSVSAVIPQILTWTIAAGLIQAVLAAAIVATPRTYAGVGVYDMHEDVRRYEHYSTALMTGEVPYRDYALEYPPVALPIFLVPHLGASVGVSYRDSFIAWMLIINGALFGLVAWWVARHEGVTAVPMRLLWLTLATTSLCPLLVLRYDLAPAALAFMAVCLSASGRRIFAGVAAGAGFLIKIFPAVVMVPELGEVVRSGLRRGGGIIAFALVTAVGMGLWLAFAGAGAMQSIDYHASRGLEIGSLYAGLAFAVEKALGRRVTIDYLHASLELTTPWTVGLARWALPIQAAALLAVGVHSARARTAEPVRDATAALGAFIVFGKVLSPQYLIWLLPFVAALPDRYGRRARVIVLACCALTTLIYPWGFRRLIRQTSGAVLVLNLRNVLLVALCVVLLGSSIREGVRSPTQVD